MPFESSDNLKPKAAVPQAEWTVVADLAILFDQKGKNGHMGSEDKLKSLEALRESTKGKPVTIVAEAITCDDSNVPEGKLSQCKNGYELERIVIHDGQETVTKLGPAKGFNTDLQDLLDYSIKEQPGNKIALAINAHGFGDQGLEGGMAEPNRHNGDLVAAADVAATVKSSLDKNGRSKLDLVDLDSCLMGQLGVLQSMSSVTDHLVASEKTETVSSSAGIDGQNLTAWVSDLTARPSMSGYELGQDIINRVNHGSNGLGGTEGASTLAHFDLRHLSDFNAKLNTLGQGLTESVQNPANRKAIVDAFGKLPDIAKGETPEPDHAATAAKRDMEGMLDILSFDMAHGIIQDQGGHLKGAVDGMQNALKDRNGLMAAVHLQSQENTGAFHVTPIVNNESGLSLYLPSYEVLNNTCLTDAALTKVNAADAGSTDSPWFQFLQSMRLEPPKSLLNSCAH
jgi:hypothetical protein